MMEKVKNSLLSIFLLALMLGFFLVFIPKDARGESGYAGAETCKSCHASMYEKYAYTLHAEKSDPRTPASKMGCETCHGPGKAHVEAGGGKGVGGIMALGPESTISKEKRDATCLQCHSKGKVVMWKGSTHESRGLSCTNCHSAHSGYRKNLAKKTQVEVCTQCHKKIRSDLRKSSHHPIREGKMQCTSCHNPHGAIADKLITANYTNLKCYECHAEKRGPYLWEHSPVTEDCTTCHTPHGSNHEFLLKGKQPYICQRCHANSRHPSQLRARSTTNAGQSVYTSQGAQLFYRSCQNCHIQVHGSNHPSGKSLMR
ncbi:MAG TPA: DmsE family decaheme c-type cytochrome [Nitrospinota bacterium]|nr:DmsE family decaheme c-type cytochrome [Nitrospinota bacterium]